MEKLQIQQLDSVAIAPVTIDEKLDVNYKPGIFLQVESFLKGDYSRFCTLAEQKKHMEQFYLRMSNYKI